ncbi:Carboxylesterase type B [Beutenbergia cavernae DSM 12333]|uniref:Carboxylic ester hydrolase n=1 Tax=Beutenbergia cavernae (strain ATCC BAA-8 / DSM 12333 / CCUG 43141 / JCM 11478 / NBRC 16432 / NCIMB 13614 / HKI 0122) TaxID=471853 RepID=C5C6H6_BEUC1|nr:carboxylesterase family protein [Beutenbergia cavernae]ACQ80382.1 Carboxylesterase type B [Beutenbergia cavernae DSM 12333]
MPRLSWVAVVATALVALTASAASAAPPSEEPPRPAAQAEPAGAHRPFARVDSGWLRGEAADGVARFTGIPYAAPPVGEARWTAPRAPLPWRGVRDATQPGPLCPQLDYTDWENPVAVGQEDCLTLDVVRPVGPGTRGRLPVLVWLYGGNLSTGGASQYDGARLAAGGDVVVVTLNYRTGALGFLSSPELDSPRTASGQFGLLDQAEALRWVQRNIDAFGGDPRRVTLAGQSAGARSVCAHLASPGSRGLFDRAIVQSGACANPVMTRADADRNGARAIERIGCADAADVAACLRATPVASLLRDFSDAQPTVFGERRDDQWGPVAGTDFLPRQPIEAIARGSAAGVPLLVGSTRDEMRSFVVGWYDALTPELYAEDVREAFGADGDAILARYPAADHAHPSLALATVLTDWGRGIGACPVLETARTASRHAPVYAYELREEAPASSPAGVPYGAYHGWDLPFLWDTSIPGSVYPELSPAQQDLADEMIGYWSSFAHDGDPNHRGAPRWQRLHGGSDAVLGLSAAAIAPTPFAQEHRCAFWDSVG